MERPQPQRAALWGRKHGPFRFHAGASSAGYQSLLCYSNPPILMLGRRLGDAHPQSRIHF